MKVYTCRDIDGVWMPGVAVIVAMDVAHARMLLAAELDRRKLSARGDETLVLLDTGTPGAAVLDDGDY